MHVFVAPLCLGKPVLKRDVDPSEVTLKFDRGANWFGITSGDKYQISFEKALSKLGSEFDYSKISLSFVRVRKYYERHNSVRGYMGAQFRGGMRAKNSVGLVVRASLPARSSCHFWDWM